MTARRGPHTCPHRTPPAVELRIVELRRVRKLGPARIGLILVFAVHIYTALIGSILVLLSG